MSDTPSHDDHWRRLAAELGLDAGPAPEERQKASPEQPAAPEEEQHGRQVDEEPPRARRRRSSVPEEEPIESSAVSHAGLFDAPTVPPNEAEIEGSDVEAAAVPEVRPEAAEEASEELADQQGVKRRRRRRSRRKKKGEGAPETANGDEPAAEESAAGAGSEDADEPVEDLGRNWNVPSWDDLIASLYRPER